MKTRPLARSIHLLARENVARMRGVVMKQLTPSLREDCAKFSGPGVIRSTYAKKMRNVQGCPAGSPHE
jgi:hypothetical protein